MIMFNTKSNFPVGFRYFCDNISNISGNAFVIGGASIYTALLPFCDRLYLTEIDDTCSDADVYFPRFDKKLYSREVLNKFDIDGVHFEHVLYTK